LKWFDLIAGTTDFSFSPAACGIFHQPGEKSVLKILSVVARSLLNISTAPLMIEGISMKQKKMCIILSFLSVCAGLYVRAETTERWINATYVKNGAVDTGNSSATLAVRSGPGLNFSQVDALSSGQRVFSDKTKDGWMRLTSGGASVPAPASAPVATPQSVATQQWINAAYVKNGAVDTGNSSATLAVRSGPGIDYTQVDSLASGQKVTVLENKNGWVRIAPVVAVAPVASPVIAVTPAPAKPPVAKNTVPVREEKSAAAAPPARLISTPVLPPRPVFAPVRPPVSNLILSGDFSGAALALPTTAGDTTAELSGRWIRSSTSAWEIFPSGGNLGPYVRAAASREAGRLLYVVNDEKRSTGSYVLRFDYILTDAADVLGVKVFVSDSDIAIGTDGGNFRMNSTQRPDDMIILSAGATWVTYYLPVELGKGYNNIYVLFVGSGAANTGIDNISLSPQRR